MWTGPTLSKAAPSKARNEESEELKVDTWKKEEKRTDAEAHTNQNEE